MKRRVQTWIARHWPQPAPDDQEARTQIVIQVRKAIVGVYLWMVVLSAGVTIALLAIESDRHRSRQSIQTSRFDSAYYSCLAANNGNRLARRDITRVLGAPTATDIKQLIDDVRPLRATNAPPPPALPTHIPVAWVQGCTAYAAAQTSLNPPRSSVLPPVTTPTIKDAP